jgi:DNA-binding LacI/PurR family transcriptional regulator
MATQRDVAKKARVSIATVSRSINSKGYVSPGVRDRINRAILDLGYKPNLVARSLKLKKTRTIGLIFPDIENPFFISLVKKAEEVAHRNNYSVILCNTENKAEKEKMYIDVLLGRIIDGFIIIPSLSTNPQMYAALKKEKAVFVDRTSGMKEEICITLDNVDGVMLAVDHLAGLGHRRIGVVNVPLDITTGLDRYEGYKKGLATHGVALDMEIVRFADFTPEAACAKTIEILKGQRPPTALLPMSGPTTIGSLRAVRELRLKVPDDISIVGFDEFTYAELLNPPLTTISQPAYDFGSIATETLLKLVRGKRVKTGRIELKPRLIVRESCGKVGALQ